MSAPSLLDLIYDAHKRLAQLEEEPRDYGTGRLFYASEIHTLVCIGGNPYINLTSLAGKLEVSKSAAFKFVGKLIQSGCVEKTKAQDNDRDVLFHVTPAGKRAIEGHDRFQESAFGPLRAIESRLGVEEREAIAGFLRELSETLRSGGH